MYELAEGGVCGAGSSPGRCANWDVSIVFALKNQEMVRAFSDVVTFSGFLSLVVIDSGSFPLALAGGTRNTKIPLIGSSDGASAIAAHAE